MATKFLSFSFIFLLTGLFSLAQNLVPNPDFEEYENGCPENLHDLPVGWNRWRFSANSFNTCVEPIDESDSLGWAPLNGFGFQIPKSGESYIGLAGTGASTEVDFREYVGCQLIQPLEIGVEYSISMYSSLAYHGFYWNMTWACNKLGFYFTTSGNYDPYDNPLEIPNVSQVYSEEVITDYENWTFIEGNFVADQEYTHMALGVFFQDEFVDQVSLDGVNSLTAYYYIDNVGVVKEKAAGQVSHAVSNSIVFVPNPADFETVIHGIIPGTNVQIFSMTGVLMHKFTSDDNLLRIATVDFPAGTYIVHISGENYATKEKLVIVH